MSFLSFDPVTSRITGKWEGSYVIQLGELVLHTPPHESKAVEKSLPVLQVLVDQATVLQAIIEHGLQVVRIPSEITIEWPMSEFKTGDRIKETHDDKRLNPVDFDSLFQLCKNDPSYRFDLTNRRYYRLVAVRTTHPNHGGQWMCQVPNPHVGWRNKVQWVPALHHLAPTLQQSVGLFLESLKNSPAEPETNPDEDDD